MTLKRMIAMLLALAMVFAMAACGSSEKPAATQAPAAEAPAEGEADGALDFGGAELVVATWGWAEAGLKTLAADFESQYNCTIVVDPTSGNGDRLKKLMAEKADPTADVALLNKSFAETGIQNDLFEQLSDKEIYAKLYEKIDECLDERERRIILLRYGIGNRKALTQREIAAMCGISRSYVSRIEKKALQKLEKALSE